jgi:hypothetical protein
MMAVFGLDFRAQLIQGVLSMSGSQDYTSIASQVERQPVAFRQPRIPDNCLGNPDRQAVSPFRHLRLIRHIDLH